MRKLKSFATLLRDNKGTAAIEVAVVSPVLLMMSLGGYDLASMVSRRTALQEVTAESAAIVMAAIAENDDLATLGLEDNGTVNTNNTSLGTIKSAAMASSGLSASHVTISKKVKCGTGTSVQSGNTTCSSGDETSTYLEIRLNGSYTPNWTNFGIGAPVPIEVARLVQVS